MKVVFIVLGILAALVVLVLVVGGAMFVTARQGPATGPGFNVMEMGYKAEVEGSAVRADGTLAVSVRLARGERAADRLTVTGELYGTVGGVPRTWPATVTPPLPAGPPPAELEVTFVGGPVDPSAEHLALKLKVESGASGAFGTWSSSTATSLRVPPAPAAEQPVK